MKVWATALLILLAGCINPDADDDDPEAPSGGSDEEGDGRPVLFSFGVDIAPYDPATGQAGDILFSRDLMYDDGRVHNDRPFVDFGWTHDYYEMANIEYWFYVPLHMPVRAPVSGTVSIDHLDHTDDWAIHFDSGTDWIVSFEHVVDLRVEDGDEVAAGDIVADAAPRPGFGNDLAMVELAVWRGGPHIIKACPADFLDPDRLDGYEQKMDRLARDWEEYLGEDVYDEDSWVSPGCLVHEIQET